MKRNYWCGLSVTWGVLTAMMATTAMGQSQRELDQNSAGGLFARMWRTSACAQADDPRYPSVSRNGKDQLLLLFTEHPSDGSEHVLALAYSDDEGRTWSDPRTIYRAKSAAPQALGTLTRVGEQLIAPFVDGDRVYQLVSQDDGTTWGLSAPIDCSPLQAATPYGRLVQIDHELLMPLFGKLSVAGRMVDCSGLLRSRDGGKTWGNFTVIACDREEGKIAYGPTAVHVDTSGRLLAMISVDDRFIYRSISTDGGVTWSRSDQRLLACNPALVLVGDVLACVDQDPQDRGVIRVQFSHDLFDSWRCDRMLDQDLKGVFSSAIALDEDRLLLVHDRGGFKTGGRGTRATAGIEVATMQRNRQCPLVTKKLIPPKDRDRWEFDQHITTSLKYFGSVTKGPDGNLYTMVDREIYASTDRGRTFAKVADGPPRASRVWLLKSGRWITIARDDSGIEEEEAKGNNFETGTGEVFVGRGEDGYDRYKIGGVRGTLQIWIYYSDDQGQTWNGQGKPIDISPLVWASGNDTMIECEDGTLVMSLYGGLNERDTLGRVDCTGVFRSKDSGKSWGDFSLIAYDEQHHEIAYNETDIQVMPDGTWTAVIRIEWHSHAFGEASSSSVSFSTDRGRTWTKPQFAFIGAVPDVELLPDGGLVCATSFNKFRISYDGGHTWSRECPSYTRHYPGVRVVGERNDTLLLHDYGAATGSYYRRVPPLGKGG